MSSKGVAVGLFGAVLLFGACSGGDDERAQVAPTASAGSSYTPAVRPAPASTIRPVPASPKIVTRVIDGDTFELTNGARVRVLGIDSCEMSTAAGQRAKVDAERLLNSGAVTLAAEPKVDKDQYGRYLRYVTVNGVDFGERMVGYDHTAVYAGENDASASYVADLRAHDSNGRTCDDPAPPPAATQNHYVPVPSGGEDDHHHKSRFCGRHIWC